MDRPEERLALIEIIDPHERVGHAARALDVWSWPLTIGRAIDNHLVLDDPFVAAHHALLEPDAEGRLRLTVLDTANGVTVGGVRHRSGAQLTLPAGGVTLQLGAGRLRLRLPGEMLAAEKPLPALLPGRRLPLLAGGLVLLLSVAEHWLSLDPGADATAWLPVLVGVPAALAGWCGVWALMSKLFQHRFDFVGHARILLPWLLALMAVNLFLPQWAATLGWPWLWRLAPPLQALLGAWLLHAHLVHVLPLHRRSVSAAVAAVLLAGGAISLTLTHRSTDSYSRAPYMSTLPLPALNWATPVPAATLVQGMEPLAQRLAQRVKKAREDEEDDGGDVASAD